MEGYGDISTLSPLCPKHDTPLSPDVIYVHTFRLEQLLVMGSLVLKEESGYRAFYHHLIKPYEHYVPVWKEVRGSDRIFEVWEY